MTVKTATAATVSATERKFLEFVKEHVPTTTELKISYSKKLITTMQEKGLITKPMLTWRLTAAGVEAIAPKAEPVKAAKTKGQDSGAGELESCPDETQLALPMETRDGIR